MRTLAIRCATLALALLLTACVTPRLHSDWELAAVADKCGVQAGDLIQEAELVKVVVLYTVAPSAPQLDCVHKWARKKRLHLAYIEAVDRTGP